MPPRIGDIDRWIEEGLTRYGRGEVDAALEAWENALSIDPDNALANSYVDYVRAHYDLLLEGTSGPTLAPPDELGGPPAGIGDELDYQIEIVAGEQEQLAKQPSGPIVRRASMEAIDEGWAIEDEINRPPALQVPSKSGSINFPIPAPRASSASIEGAAGTSSSTEDGNEIEITRTISADLPPPAQPMMDEPPGTDGTGGFDDMTREYQKGRPPTRDLELTTKDGPPHGTAATDPAGGGEVLEIEARTRTQDDFEPQLTPAFGTSQDLQTPPFGSPQDVATPGGGFGSQVTGIRKRDTGFVRPTAGVTASPVPITTRGDGSRIDAPAAPKLPATAPMMPVVTFTPPRANTRDALNELFAADPEPSTILPPEPPAAAITPAPAPAPARKLELDLDPDEAPALEIERPLPATTTHRGLAAVSPAPAPPRAKRTSNVPELKMTLRTPEPPPPDDVEITIERRRAPSSGHDEHESPTLGPSGTRAITADRLEEERLFGADVETKDLPGGGALVRGIALASPGSAGARSGAERRGVEIELGAAGNAVSTRDLPHSEAAAAAELAGLRAAGPSTRELPPTTRPPASASRPPANQPAQDQPPNILLQPTRDLGIRPGPATGGRMPRLQTEDEPTAQAEIPRAPVIGQAAPTRTPKRTAEQQPTNTIDVTSRLIMDTIDRDTPPPDGADESRDDRTRRRITGLLDHANAWLATGEADKAVAAVDLVLEEDAASALAQKLVHRHAGAIMGVFQQYLGDLQRQPMLARPLAELANAPISPRAAFLLSRIDGMLSLDEILDVSGMPRLEAYRYLCQLFLRGILK